MHMYSRDELLIHAEHYRWPGEDEAIAAGAPARRQGYYTLEGLWAVERFKIHGPRQRVANENDPRYVEKVTRTALGARGENAVEDRTRIEGLTRLHGVRYRVASMLLHLAYPFEPPAAGYPAMDRLTALALGLEAKDFESWPLYEEHADRCRTQAELAELDLRTVDRALMVIGGMLEKGTYPGT